MFEQIGRTYTQQGDYFLSGLIFPSQETRSVGIWGQRRKKYLREHHRVLYYILLTQRKLDSHLTDVEEQAQTMFEYLMAQMAKQQGVTEMLKASDMTAWVGRMNNIRNAVEEVIQEEIIFVCS